MNLPRWMPRRVRNRSNASPAPAEIVATIVRAYGAERRRGVSPAQAFENVAEHYDVRGDALGRVPD